VSGEETTFYISVYVRTYIHTHTHSMDL